MVRKAAGYGSVLLCVYPDIDTLRSCDEYADDDSSRDDDVLMFADDDDPLDPHGECQPSRIRDDDEEEDACQHLAEEMNLDADADWTEILDNQTIVLNDRMMTDAMQSPRIQSEHSYSLTLNDEMPPSPFGLSHNIKLEDYSKDMETDCFPSVVSISSGPGQTDFPVEDILIKQEPPSPPPRIPSPSRSSATTISALLGAPSSPLHPQSLLKQPTIVLASRTQQQLPPSVLGSSLGLTARDLLYTKVKLEPTLSTSGFPFPPTPPSCNGSDSDGSLSPVHSLRPPTSPPVSYGAGTPSSSSSSSGGAGSSRKGHAKVLLSGNSSKHASQTSLISSQPKGATGVLVLTEEEKRTLLAEGYPIPQRLPLTKAEERSLKKIRRKIKNKISAQESRRKKKEYMDSLEKKVEVLVSENSDFKKKVDSLEGSNKSLLSQLQQLQAILESQMSHKRSRNAATQTFPSSPALGQFESGRSAKTAEFMDLSDAKAR